MGFLLPKPLTSPDALMQVVGLCSDRHEACCCALEFAPPQVIKRFSFAVEFSPQLLEFAQVMIAAFAKYGVQIESV